MQRKLSCISVHLPTNADVLSILGCSRRKERYFYTHTRSTRPKVVFWSKLFAVSHCSRKKLFNLLYGGVRMHPMASATDVRRNLHLVEKKRRDEIYISPSKKKSVQREVAKVRRKVLSKFTSGERIDRTEGSLTWMCLKMYIQKLVEEQDRPDGRHFELHQPVCLGYQISKELTMPIFRLLS
jgi:hypothetical protein